MKPLVSVVMPVYNAEDTLPAALSSLSRQGMAAFEVVAVDDGSTDGSLGILERHAAKDKRFRVIPAGRMGIVSALNLGVGESRGEFIARMDADDVCHPARLALQAVALTKDAGLALVGSRVRLFPRPRLMGGMLHYESWVNSIITHDEIIREIFVESPLPHPSVMFIKGAFESLGGYRDMGWPEDYDLWLRMAASGMRLSKAEETLLYWREGCSRLSRTHPMYSKEGFMRVKARFLKTWRLKDTPRVQIWGAGRDGKAWAKLLVKEGFEVAQFLDIDKKKVGGQACGGIPVAWPGDVIKGLPVLCAVGVKGARAQIRDYLSLEGMAEPEEFLFLA